MRSMDVRRPIHPQALELYDKYQLFFNMDRKSDFFSILNPEEEELVGELMIKNITGRTSAILWLDQLDEEQRLVLDLVYNKLSQPGLYGKRKLNRRNSNKRNSNKRNSNRRNSNRRNSNKRNSNKRKLNRRNSNKRNSTKK